MNQLTGARIGIGAEDSGTQRLARHLLRDNGITEDAATLVKTLPPVYRWRIRRRILRWYVELRRIDLALEGEPPAPERLEALSRELHNIESEAARVDVPLAYSDALYNLRLHIDLLGHKLQRHINGATRAS